MLGSVEQGPVLAPILTSPKSVLCHSYMGLGFPVARQLNLTSFSPFISCTRDGSCVMTGETVTRIKVFKINEL